MELDSFDRKLLSILQQDARRTAEAMGLEVGLSASAVQRRVARLRETGVIVAEVAVIDQKTLGRPLTMMVEVAVESERPELLAAFRQWLNEQQAIQDAWYVTGEYDYLLVLASEDVETFERFVQRLVVENENVRRFHTRVALGTLKRGWRLPTGSAS